ncbi:FAD-dependent hydroxylase [Microcoleus sp. F8-D3]
MNSYDAVIIGGGIAGLTLACGLRSSGLNIAIIEAQSAQQGTERPRAYALSPLSARIFRDLGLWEQIAPAIAHFPKVVLSDADYPYRVEFLPEDIDEPAVYYCAEHRVLLAALQRQIEAAANITTYYETQVVEVCYKADSAELLLSNGQTERSQIQTQLVVAADGSRSQVREQAGIQTIGWNYWQSCITAFVSPSGPHQNIAWERFWAGGPFAILPLPENRCQIVWIAPHAEAEALVALPPDRFMAELQNRYGEQSGTLTLLSQPLIFPARLMQSKCYCSHRLVLLGDAAHVCHPVGGQGLNMGIRDAAALTQILQTTQNQDLGSLAVLRRYDSWRRYESWVVLAFTDLLNRSFSNGWLPLVLLRRSLLHLMILWFPLRQMLLRLMTGLWGWQPQSSMMANLISERKQPENLY